MAVGEKAAPGAVTRPRDVLGDRGRSVNDHRELNRSHVFKDVERDPDRVRELLEARLADDRNLEDK